MEVLQKRSKKVGADDLHDVTAHLPPGGEVAETSVSHLVETAESIQLAIWLTKIKITTSHVSIMDKTIVVLFRSFSYLAIHLPKY